MDAKEWTVPDLLQFSGGYWNICALHAGVKLDLFTPLSGKPQTASELASQIKCSERGLEMLLNALVAMNFLKKAGGIFSVTDFSAKFLSRSSNDFIGYIILHHHELMEGWSRLDEGVRSGGPFKERISHSGDETARENFEMGMFNLAMQLAPRIVSNIDLTGRKRLLDLGGGPGTYAIHFCKQNPELNAVVYDLPGVRRFAEKTIARFNLTDRIVFEEGDFLEQEIKGRFDTAWLSHILHGEGPQGCAQILEKAVKTLEPGALIMVQEFILDDAQTGPLFPALFSLNMLLATPEGSSYSFQELAEMMTQAGVEDIRRLPIELPNGAGVVAGNVATG